MHHSLLTSGPHGTPYGANHACGVMLTTAGNPNPADSETLQWADLEICDRLPAWGALVPDTVIAGYLKAKSV